MKTKSRLHKAVALCFALAMLISLAVLFPPKVSAVGFTEWTVQDTMTGEIIPSDEFEISDEFVAAATNKLKILASGNNIRNAPGTQNGEVISTFDASYLDVHNFKGRWETYWQPKLKTIEEVSVASIPIDFTGGAINAKVQIADAMLSFIMSDNTLTTSYDYLGYMLFFHDNANVKTGSQVASYYDYELIYTCFPHYFYLVGGGGWNAAGMPGSVMVIQKAGSGTMHWFEEKQATQELVGELSTATEGATTDAENVRKNANDWLTANCVYNNPQSPGSLCDHGGQRAYCALEEGLPVCNGYALAYSLLCLSNGVDMRYMSGLADKSNPNSAHAWNLFYKDETPTDTTLYLTDVTWNDGDTPNTNYYEKPWSEFTAGLDARSLTLGTDLMDAWFEQLNEIDNENKAKGWTFQPETSFDFEGVSVDYEDETITIPAGMKYSITDTMPADWTAISDSDTATTVSLGLPANTDTKTVWFYKAAEADTNAQETAAKFFARKSTPIIKDTNTKGGEITLEANADYEYKKGDTGEWTTLSEEFNSTDGSIIYYRKKATSTDFATELRTVADNGSSLSGNAEDNAAPTPDNDDSYPSVEPTYGAEPVISYSLDDNKVFLKFAVGTSKFWEYSKSATSGYKSAIAVDKDTNFDYVDITAFAKDGKATSATAGDVYIYVRHKATETSEAAYDITADTETADGKLYKKLTLPIEGRMPAPKIQLKFKLNTKGENKGKPVDGDTAKYNSKDIVFDPYTDAFYFATAGTYVFRFSNNKTLGIPVAANEDVTLTEIEALLDVKMGLDNLNIAETVYISFQGSNEDGNAKPSSKEVKFSIPARASAPKAAVDYKKNYIKGVSTAMEYKAGYQTGTGINWDDSWKPITAKTLDLSAVPHAVKIAIRTKATYSKRASLSKVLDLAAVRAAAPAFNINLSTEKLSLEGAGSDGVVYEYRINKFKKTAIEGELTDSWTAWTEFGSTKIGSKQIQEDDTIDIAALGAIPSYGQKAVSSGTSTKWLVEKFVLEVRVKGTADTRASASVAFNIKPRPEMVSLALASGTKYITLKNSVALPTDGTYEYYTNKDDTPGVWKDITSQIGGTSAKGTKFYVRLKTETDVPNSAIKTITIT